MPGTARTAAVLTKKVYIMDLYGHEVARTSEYAVHRPEAALRVSELRYVAAT